MIINLIDENDFLTEVKLIIVWILSSLFSSTRNLVSCGEYPSIFPETRSFRGKKKMKEVEEGIRRRRRRKSKKRWLWKKSRFGFRTRWWTARVTQEGWTSWSSSRPTSRIHPRRFEVIKLSFFVPSCSLSPSSSPCTEWEGEQDVFV